MPKQDGLVSFWIAKKDAQAMETDKIIRLMELFNIKITGISNDAVDASFESESYEEIRKIKAQLIQWIPHEEAFDCQIMMPDASVVEGYVESACKNLKPQTTIQFERFGFAKVDEVNQKLVAYYAHK